MRWRHYELLWLIRHIGPFLSQNQADARLASLRIFFRDQKQNGQSRQLLNYVLDNIFAPKTLRNTILVSTPCFQVQESNDANQTLYI